MTSLQLARLIIDRMDSLDLDAKEAGLKSIKDQMHKKLRICRSTFFHRTSDALTLSGIRLDFIVDLVEALGGKVEIKWGSQSQQNSTNNTSNNVSEYALSAVNSSKELIQQKG